MAIEGKDDVVDGENSELRSPPSLGEGFRKPSRRLSSDFVALPERRLTPPSSPFLLVPDDLVTAVAYELSRVLDTGLDKETLSILIALCENGVNPEVRTDVSPAATVSLVFADPI